jgi:hypothetical protein
MLVFPSMLIPAAIAAGIKVPKDVDNFDSNEFPYFSVFCTIQLCRPMHVLSEHWDNAKIIADIPDKKIRKITIIDLINKGLSISF